VTQYGPSVTAAIEVPHEELVLLVTAIETALEVLPAYVLSPAYTAVIDSVPAALKLVVSVAFPELSVPVPIEVAPS
jgi:hypothetical protein